MGVPQAPLPSFALLSESGPYRTLVEALDYGVLLYDPAASVLVHNAAAAQVLGLSAAELTGRAPPPPSWALFYEDGAPVTSADHPVARAFKTGRAVRELVLRVTHQDGLESWLQVTVQPLFTAAGAPYVAVASMIDITTQRHTVAQLERHVRFRTRLSAMVAASLQDDLGNTFYQHLMEGAVDAIPGAQAGSLLLRGDDGRYSFVAAVNFDQTVLAQVKLYEHELYRDPTITGPQLIYGFDNSGIKEPERHRPLYEAGDTAGIKVSLSIPIEVGGQLVAYFNLDNFDDPQAFGDGGAEMGQLFAHQVGALWRRFRLETELASERRALEHMAFFDLLTGLPNRALLGDRLEQALLQSARTSTPVALIFLDLDNFKGVNDALGHDFGDALLRAVGARLASCVRVGDTVARWGGDEFVVLLPQLAGPEDAAQVARTILSALREPLALAGREITTGASLGVSFFPEPARDADDLIKHADIALYRVKAAGRGGFQFFSDEMNASLQNRVQLEAEVRRVLKEGSLRLAYQPRVWLSSGEIESFAVRVVWPHREQLTTGSLLPGLNEPDLIMGLCERVLHLVCEQLRSWQSRARRVALGVPFELLGNGLAELLARMLQLYATDSKWVAATGLELSFYGGEALTPADLHTLHRLRATGVHLSLQHFGGLTSSLNTLRELLPQSLGIDASVVSGLGNDPLSSSLVQATVLLGGTLGAQVFAQGVETDEQRRVLEQLGCTQAQGPLFGKPLSAEAVTKLLTSRNKGLPKQI